MAKVLSNKPLADKIFLLKVRFKDGINVKPGQFFNIKVCSEESYDPLLRRPLSVFDFDEDNNEVSFVYEIKGRGTRALSNYIKGDSLDIHGPLGNGFTVDFNNKKLILAGGGMGIVPLFYLAKYIEANNDLTLCLGAANKEVLKPLADYFANIAVELKLSTDDGSFGSQGTISCLLNNSSLGKEVEYDYLFGCGPEPMLGWLQSWLHEEEISGEFSLEERMACGNGLCLSCSCKTNDGNKRLCKEGPVLPASEVMLGGL
ncbi:dihydroorotate dehydrogenase electron transfer subunit [Halanaerobiaceae bacterium Z-7014]|uniref:Dihydroorotate dehydrogenase electron transfer subunit n=1 Tax=Halonatronomonas betaini TaxID=2778430 RepID=A0A931AMR1_9FIRM|nr:dihydroorotate dehydrogenase electron transfer subunit [Halonatronomonas betaini]